MRWTERATSLATPCFRPSETHPTSPPSGTAWAGASVGSFARRRTGFTATASSATGWPTGRAPRRRRSDSSEPRCETSSTTPDSSRRTWSGGTPSRPTRWPGVARVVWRHSRAWAPEGPRSASLRSDEPFWTLPFLTRANSATSRCQPRRWGPTVLARPGPRSLHSLLSAGRQHLHHR